MLKNVSFETIYSNKFTLSTQAYNTKLPYLKSELRPKGFQIVVDVLLKIIIINNISAPIRLAYRYHVTAGLQ